MSSNGYLGSKAGAGVFQAIIALMPPHDTYVELFAGSGAILRKKPAAAQSYVVDLDETAPAMVNPGAATVIHGDALTFLDNFDHAGSGRTLIYADPPYLHSTRTSKHRYKYEMTDADHRALLQRLILCPAAVILSGYPSQMYDSMLGGWRSREFQAMTRGGVRTEKLWFNFEPSAVHYATFAGIDYIDRQRIKRKAARWAKMFASMEPGERAAVLAAILGVDPSQSRATVNKRPQQMLMSVQPAASSLSTIGDRVCADRGATLFHLPDSGVTKPVPAAGGISPEAQACS